ncbi:uncharacterized protein LOC121837779 [Ixodes scapularis]|uniref:uncharacterized protein LOC121837779 n=1 Tax=Ixodes scapularis TaxID=6945 RepID=UPI001C38FD5A|nr:uncharacterized protein LOC121837779 [Ixodes scapularis]
MVGESDEVPFSVPDDLSDFEKQIVERLKQLGLVPYDTPDRERDDPDDAVAESSELSPHPDLWRLDNTDWCSCSRCAVLPSFVPDECRCCRDMGPKLTRIQRLRCITTHEEFPLVCLNLVMLRLAYFELHDRRFAMHHDMHRRYRYVAYRRFVRWVWGRLGRGNRFVLPSCVVRTIREAFPCEEETGFRYPRFPRSQVHKPGLNEVFLGALVHADNGDPWYIKAKVNNQEVTFKVDTGADVTAIPHTEYKVGEVAKLEPAGEDLRGAGDSPLTTLGKFQATITWNGRTTRETVYVSERLRHPLLCLPAIQALQVLPSLNEIKADNHLEHDRVLAKYPSLFQGLGKIKSVCNSAWNRPLRLNNGVCLGIVQKHLVIHKKFIKH